MPISVMNVAARLLLFHFLLVELEKEDGVEKQRTCGRKDSAELERWLKEAELGTSSNKGGAVVGMPLWAPGCLGPVLLLHLPFLPLAAFGLILSPGAILENLMLQSSPRLPGRRLH